MRVQDSFLLSATIEDVWQLFMNAEKLGRCVPGCEEVTSISPTEYKAKMEVKIQFMKLAFDAKGELKNSIFHESIEVEMIGKPLALAGLFRSQMKLQLEEIEPQVVKVFYDMDLQMSGRLATLGDVLLKGTIKKNAEQFAENVQQFFIEENV